MERIGFVGLGIMGSRQAANLRRAGYELTVYNRTRERAEAWAAEHGATVAATPAEVGAASDVIITMVVDGAQVQEVVLGEDGVAQGAAEGALCVDMSTIAPGDSRRIAAALDERGIGFVDAPVTGSSPKAEDGTLTIMASGAADGLRPRPAAVRGRWASSSCTSAKRSARARWSSSSTTPSPRPTRTRWPRRSSSAGPPASTSTRWRRSWAPAAAARPMLALKAGPMREHDYSTLFKLEHMLKDVRLCLEEGQAAGVPFPAAAAVREALTAGMGRGLGDADFAALVETVEGLAGVRL